MSAIVLPIILDDAELQRSFDALQKNLSSMTRELEGVTSDFTKSLNAQGRDLAKATTHNLEAATKKAQDLAQGLSSTGNEAKKVSDGFSSIVGAIKEATEGQERDNSEVVSTARNVMLLRSAYKFYISDLGSSLILAARNRKELGGMLAALQANRGTILEKVKAFAKVGVAVAGVTATMWALYRVTEATFNLINRESRSQSLGVMRQDVQGLVEAYGGLISRAEATGLAMQFRQAGIPKSLLADAFTLTTTLEKLTGQTTEATAASIAQGNVSEDVLKRIGLTQEQLEHAYQAAQGASQRSLTQQEKSVIALRLMSEAAKGLRQDVLQAFPDSPFKKAGVSLANLWQSVKELAATFVKVLLPIIEAVEWTLTKVVQGIDFITRGVVNVGRGVLGFSDKTKKASDAASRLSEVLDNTQKNTRKVGERLQASNEEISRFRGLVQAAKEAARTALNTALGSVAGLTGASGNLLKEQTALVVEVSKFGVIYGKMAGQAINLTTKSLGLQLIELGIYGKKRSALMQLAAQGEMYRNTLTEIFSSSKLLLVAERAMLGISGEQAALYQARIDKRKEEIAQTKQQATFSTQIAILEAKQEEILFLRRKARSKAERDSLAQQFNFLRSQQAGIERLQELQTAFNKARMETLRLQVASANIDRNTASQRERLRLQQEQFKESWRLQDLWKKANDETETSTVLQIERQRELGELEDRRRALALDIERTQARLAAGLVKGDALEKERNELALLKQKQATLKEEGDLRAKIFEQQLEETTVVGAAMAKLKRQGVDMAKSIGDALTTNLLGAITSIGSAFSSLFSDLVRGEKDAGANFGKALLSALGDMAIAFATTFAGIGAGKIALGDFAGGAGLLAASVALFAAAGLVKGIAAGASSTSATTSQPRQQLPQVQPAKEQERNTFILVSNRIFGSEEDQARALKNFAQRNQRVTGKIL